MAEDDDNTFSSAYEQVDWDFVVAENLTGVGKFSRQIVSFVTLMAAAGGVPVLGALGRVGGTVDLLGGETLRGAVADLVMSADGGSLSDMLEEVAPGLKNTWVTVLAIGEEDNPWEQRIKNVLEGGVLGLAVDGVGELIGAVRAGRAVKAAGFTEDEAVDAAINAIKEPPKTRPNKAFREAEAELHGSSKDSGSLFDVQERAAKETSFELDEVIKSQAKAEDFDNVLPVSATPMLIDYAHRATTNNEGALAETIAAVGARIDIDELSKELVQSNDEIAAKALFAVREFLGAADESPEDAMKALGPINFKDAEGRAIGSREAVVATKTLVKDTAYQINDVATAALDLVEDRADVVIRQVPMLVVGPPGGGMMGLQMKGFA